MSQDFETPKSLRLRRASRHFSAGATPIADKLEAASFKLNSVSNYKSEFSYEPIRSLELRHQKTPVRFGFLFKTGLKLVNSHSTCQQCLYAFELDTYGRGCVFNCHYCYAKEQLSSHGEWNQPFPVPIDINSVRKIFYRVFETDGRSKWRSILERKIPLRIGSMSDSFMKLDENYGVTKELLRILSHYDYPYIIFTRSPLVARQDYLELLRKDLCSVQFSISSTNRDLTRMIEPGAPTPERRLEALETLNRHGFWTTVRVNPLFPNYPDGHYTDPKKFSQRSTSKRFDYSTPEMLQEFADTGTPAVLVGFARLSPKAIKNIEVATGVNLKDYFNNKRKDAKDFHYSANEVRYYYEMYRDHAQKAGIEFTTCYIGNGEGQFWSDQDLWSNQKDCCNAIGQVASFRNNSREIPFSTRLQMTNNKCAEPVDPIRLHEELGEPDVSAWPSQRGSLTNQPEAHP